MSGTIAGGKRAATTNKKRHGKDFYEKIGALGGKLGHTGGFYADRQKAKTAGKIGGLKSRRGGVVIKPLPTEEELELIKSEGETKITFKDLERYDPYDNFGGLDQIPKQRPWWQRFLSW